jgi:uncharacterized protein
VSCVLEQLNIEEKDQAISFGVLVSPRASRSRFGPVSGDRIKVFVTSPPVDGKANEAIISLVARSLGVRKNAVSIVSGDRGKRKVVRVQGISRQELERAVT